VPTDKNTPKIKCNQDQASERRTIPVSVSVAYFKPDGRAPTVESDRDGGAVGGAGGCAGAAKVVDGALAEWHLSQTVVPLPPPNVEKLVGCIRRDGKVGDHSFACAMGEPLTIQDDGKRAIVRIGEVSGNVDRSYQVEAVVKQAETVYTVRATTVASVTKDGRRSLEATFPTFMTFASAACSDDACRNAKKAEEDGAQALSAKVEALKKTAGASKDDAKKKEIEALDAAAKALSASAAARTERKNQKVTILGMVARKDDAKWSGAGTSRWPAGLTNVTHQFVSGTFPENTEKVEAWAVTIGERVITANESGYGTLTLNTVAPGTGPVTTTIQVSGAAVGNIVTADCPTLKLENGVFEVKAAGKCKLSLSNLSTSVSVKVVASSKAGASSPITLTVENGATVKK
jgi:hypothetical protein